MAQKNEIYQALDNATCWEDQFSVGFGLFRGFLDNKKKYKISPDMSIN